MIDVPSCLPCPRRAASRSKAIRDFQIDPPTKVFLITHRCAWSVL